MFTGEIMADPVRLPTSGYILDRISITRHLLNDSSDPYTRAPLTIDQVITDVEMKLKIDQYLQSKKNK